MNTTITLKQLSINQPFVILGHEFHGLEDVAAAVELSGSTFALNHPQFFRTRTPEQVIPGIHIAEIWESYPCFDAEDRMYENRTYQNYFFSEEPFSPAKVCDIISKCTNRCNYQFVNSEMPADFTPALYYVGDGDKMLLALSL